MRATRHGLGFTIVELLMVIVIIGVVTAIVVPRIGAAMSGGRLRVGARSVVQSARYARTMALLHQIDIDLVLDAAQEKGRIRVEAAPLSGERADGGTTGRIELDSGDGGDDPDAAAGKTQAHPADEMAPQGQVRFAAGDGQYGSAIASGAQVSAAALADEIATEIESPGCTYEFLGYTDKFGEPSEMKTSGGNGEDEKYRVRFRSNGTCRPFNVKVTTGESESLYVSFDILGTATVSAAEPR